VTFLQRTFTSLVHAHAGRTQGQATSVASLLGQPCRCTFCAWLRHYCSKITATSLPLLAALWHISN
jgi:hypothetical protein